MTVGDSEILCSEAVFWPKVRSSQGSPSPVQLVEMVASAGELEPAISQLEEDQEQVQETGSGTITVSSYWQVDWRTGGGDGRGGKFGDLLVSIDSLLYGL